MLGDIFIANGTILVFRCAPYGLLALFNNTSSAVGWFAVFLATQPTQLAHHLLDKSGGQKDVALHSYPLPINLKNLSIINL